ncbi:hypothetical protein DFH09DRAFT_949601, partial [Mycena vulgaris]
VGIAAQLPSGSTSPDDLDYQSFWSFLVKGGKAYEPLDNVLPKLTRYVASPINLPAQGAFLKNATSFDNISLGISVRDARVIPYSGRRLLDLSFQALQDAGIDSRGQKVGCFMSGNLALEGVSGSRRRQRHGSCAWMSHTIANRISYTLNITGPSVFLDTACSSSLVALHLAVSAIERGDCSAAIVGAAQINRDPSEWVSYAQAGLLSPDGMCKPFDEKADGFGRGEGAVAVVLKPLKDAIRDNDHVYSVVVGSAINATGSRMPVNVPDGITQQQCVYEAYRRAQLMPQDADYIELHATGTSVGDPIETNAAGALFGKDAVATFGSLKGNLGHLEVAAFLASLVKACLIFEHEIIPPTVNFASPARSINWDNFNVDVPAKPTVLGCRSSSGRSTISLSAAGIGGATGHVVIQSPPASKQPSVVSSTTAVLFLIGGLSLNVVGQISAAASLMDTKNLGQYAVTLSRRARQLPWRTYFTLPLSPSAVIPSATLVPNESISIAFVFSGQGPQNFQMGRQLFTEYPVFRKTILDLDSVYEAIRGVSLLESTGLFTTLGSKSSSSTVTLTDLAWPVAITLPAISMIQIAMFDLLKSVGIVPDMMCGHSAGETAILYASGAGSKEMAMEIAIARGEAMTHTESQEVGMAMLTCNADHASALIAHVTANTDGVLEISCFNTSESVAVSGTAALLDQLVALGKSQGLFAQRIRTMVPGHSSFMDCIKDEYLSQMDDIFARYPGSHAPRIPVFSTCQEQPLVEAFTATYFWDNCRNAVQFSNAVLHSLTSSPVFVEISCHPVLSSSILAHGVPEARVLCPMRRISAKASVSSGEPDIFLDTLGRLSRLGVNTLDLSGLYGFSAVKSKSIDHPLTPRVISPAKSLSSQLPGSIPGSNRPLASSNLRINNSTHPDLAEHDIHGESVFPATGFIELVLEAGANFLWDVNFKSILSLASNLPLQVDLQRLDSNWCITTNTVRSAPMVRNAPTESGATGFWRAGACSRLHGPVESTQAAIRKRFFRAVGGPSAPLITYGPRFQRILRCHGGPMEMVAEIEGPTAVELAQNYLLNPVIMDACLHVILHPNISKEYFKEVIYLPSRLEYFVYYRRDYGAGNWFSHIRLRKWSPDHRYYDVMVTDSRGLALCEMRNLVVKKFTPGVSLTVKRRFDLMFQPASVHVDIPRFKKTFSQKTNQSDILRLYDILDCLATEMISKSLDHDICTSEVTASELDDLVSLKTSTQRVVDVLYSDDLMAKFYAEFGQTSNVCVEAAKAFSAVLDSLRKSGKKSLKILECGAGTGLLTRQLVDELKQNPDLLTEYTLTDISYAVSYDISKDPSAQEIPWNSYDVIVALHALHAAPSVDTCLASLQKLLVPGGCLLIVELNGTAWAGKSGSVWFDCVFGSFPEWFGYADGREHCTMPPTSWKGKLEVLDFENVQTYAEAGDSGRDFFFVAQKPRSRSAAAAEFSVDFDCIHRYEFGREAELQNCLSIHDPTASITVHILALLGRDADAAVGLCATLRKEFLPWVIRLCIFESVTRLADAIPLISRHAWTFDAGDNVVFFDQEGDAHVSRIVLSPPPANSTSPPHISGKDITSEDQNSVNIRITAWGGMSASYDSFVGEVVSTHRSDLSAGELIGGFAETSSEHVVRVPICNTVALTKNSLAELSGDIWSAMLESFIHLRPPWSHSVRILIAVENPNLAAIIGRQVSNITHLELVTTDFTAPDTFESVEIVFSDSCTYARHAHLRHWITRNGQLILWDELVKAEISRDPFYIGKILAKAGKASHDFSVVENGHMQPESIPSHLNEQYPRVRASPPFRADRVYVLLGGIGGLGVDLAVWLYEHGARHLVLTSRRGIESLDPVGDAMAFAKFAYLQSQDVLDLRLEQCDATDGEAMNSLLHNLPVPIAGCFHMTLALSDAPFFKQTQKTFDQAYNSKIGVLEVCATQIDIRSLDFFVAISSLSGLVGLMGQSNYASACTALAGALSQYPNAFSLITPGISDAGYLVGLCAVLQLPMFYRTFIGSHEFKPYQTEKSSCQYDGLRKLDDGPFNQYIPDLNWNLIDAQVALPRAYRHLILPEPASAGHPSVEPRNSHERILSRVLDLLEVSTNDFDTSQPLTVYGLDSVSAAAVSSLLQPYASFSQMRLLGGTTWSEIATEVEHIPLSSYGLDSLGAAQLATALQPWMTVTQMQLMGHTAWSELLQLGHVPPRSFSDPSVQPLIELCDGSGTPLIILPGANGSLTPFFGLRSHYQGPIWAIQITDSTPLESLTGLVRFWKQRICDKRPHGPYRFAAYSASALAGVILTKMMEDIGEEVLQLAFIENCPVLWTREESEALLSAGTMTQFRHLSDESVLDMLRNDPSIGLEAVSKYEAALRDLPDAPTSSQREVRISRIVMTLIFEFLQEFYPTGPRSYAAFIGPFTTWLFSIDAPSTVLVAQHGIVHSIPGGTWPDLGASRFEKPATVHYITGVGHFGLFADERVAQLLEI